VIPCDLHPCPVLSLAQEGSLQSLEALFWQLLSKFYPAAQRGYRALFALKFGHGIRDAMTVGPVGLLGYSCPYSCALVEGSHDLGPLPHVGLSLTLLLSYLLTSSLLLAAKEGTKEIWARRFDSS